MGFPRVLVDSSRLTAATVTINDFRQVHHLCTVLRLKTGSRVICFDGQGTEADGVIVRQRAGEVTVRLEQRRQVLAAAAQVWLAQGLPKGERFEWVVQKATELGVARLSPLLTERTVVRLTEEQARKKLMRWQRIAAEAAKQCGRATLLRIDPPQPLASWLRDAAAASAVLLPTLTPEAKPLKDVVRALPEARLLAVAIGPEGDFSPQEVALAIQHGAQPVSLGPLVLRTETAAVAVAAMLLYAYAL